MNDGQTNALPGFDVPPLATSAGDAETERAELTNRQAVSRRRKAEKRQRRLFRTDGPPGQSGFGFEEQPERRKTDGPREKL